MAWILLACAILTEIAATTALKYTNGLNIFTHTFLTLTVVVLYISSYVCMAQALKLQMEVSVAYALWSGIGTAAIAVIGAMFFRESTHPLKIGAIALIVVGVALLNVAPTSEGAASEGGTVHASAIRPGATMAFAEVMTGLSAAGGRHRAPAGAAYLAAGRTGPYDDSYGGEYGEPRRARHARPVWGQAAAPTARLHEDLPAADVPGRYVPRQRVPDTHVPVGYAADSYVSDQYVSDRYASDQYAATPYAADTYASDSSASDAYASDEYVSDHYGSEADIPVHQAPAYGLSGAVRDSLVPAAAPIPAPTPTHAQSGMQPGIRQAAYLGTDDASDFHADLDAAFEGDRDSKPARHDEADIVVEPAAVEPPAVIERQTSSVTRIATRKRAPIKGVTLLHPYPDRPVARAPRSA